MGDNEGISKIGKILYDFFIEKPEETQDQKKGPAGNVKLEPVASLVTGEAPVFTGPITTAGGEINFDELFKQAGIVAEGKFTVEKAREMLRKFPEDMPLETKRLSARIALEAMSKSAEEILTDAAQKVQALESYVQTGRKELAVCISEADSQIQQLQKQIEEWKSVKAAKSLAQEQLESSCKVRADEIKEVIDFFTPDVSPAAVEEANKK